MVDISFVIPAFNEEKNISPFYEKISGIMKPQDKSYEIIFVNDGSVDNTLKEINTIISSDNSVKCINLRKNFGKSIALSIGFSETIGNIIITMDSDLQDDPNEIPRFIEKINEGWDFVIGWKKIRKDPFEKRIASKLFNFVVSKISGLKLHDFNCGFKVFRKDVLKTVNVSGGLHRFMPMLAHSYGFKVCEIPVLHHPRIHGKSKYGKERYLSGFFELFTTSFVVQYQRKPMQFLGKASLMSLLFGSMLLVYVFIMKFCLGQTGDRPSLIISVFLIGLSVQLFIFGLLSDLMSHLTQKNNFRKEDFIK